MHNELTEPVAGRDTNVAEQWRTLLPTAFLLTGSDAAARQLLTRGLVAGMRMPGCDDRSRALAGLVRVHLRRSRLRAEGSISGASATPWWSSPQDAAAAHSLATALDDLDAAARTAVVLRWYEGLPADRVAELAPAADPAAAAAQLAGEVAHPADLPSRLDGLAGQCDASALSDEIVVAGVQAVRVRRRRRAGGALATIAAVVAAASWLPAAVDDVRRPTDATTPAITTPPAHGIFAEPPRGSLADDDGLLAAVRARLAMNGSNADSFQVVWGADVDGLRAILMARPTATEPETVWLLGPAGTDPAALDVLGTDGSPGAETSDSSAVVLPDPAGGRTRLIVVARPGDEVAVSPGVDLDPADGSGGRTFTRVPMSDGVAVTTLDRPASFGVQYSVKHGPLLLDALSPATAFESWSVAQVEPPLPSRSGAATASDFGYDSALYSVLAATGWGPDQVTVTVLGAGMVSAAGGDPVETVTLAVTLPNGAVVTTTGFGSRTTDTEGSSTSFWPDCGTAGYPAGTDPTRLTVTTQCSSVADDGWTYSRILVVAAPPTGNAPEVDSLVPELDRGWGCASFTPQQVADPATSAALDRLSGLGANVLTR